MNKTSKKAFTSDKRIKSVFAAGKKIPVVNVSKSKRIDWKKKYEEIEANYKIAVTTCNNNTKLAQELKTELDKKIEKNLKAGQIILDQSRKIQGLEESLNTAKEHIEGLVSVTGYYERRVEELTKILSDFICSPVQNHISDALKFMSKKDVLNGVKMTGEFVADNSEFLEKFKKDLEKSSKDWKPIK